MTRQYREYLEGPEWREKRREFFRYCFDLDRYFCWTCGERDQSLFRVHHLTYRNVFKERMEDLTLLCDACHTKFHAKELPEPVVSEVFKPAARKKEKREVPDVRTSGFASLMSFNGYNKGRFSSGDDLVSAWIAHSVKRRKARVIEYFEICKSDRDEYERVKRAARMMVERNPAP